MSDNFGLAGFALDDPEQLDELVRTVVRQGERTPVRDGVFHANWTGASGAGCDVVVGNGGVECAKPTFRGAPGARVRVASWGEDADCEWCAPLWLDVLGETSYPAVVEVDDVAVVRGWLREGEDYDVSLTVFADETVTWPDLADRAAVPVGTFGHPPVARMLIAGEVLSAERRVNELTGDAFGHARVASLSAEYDVLVPPDSLPRAGEVVRLAGWIVAHVVPPKRRWWRR